MLRNGTKDLPRMTKVLENEKVRFIYVAVNPLTKLTYGLGVLAGDRKHR